MQRIKYDPNEENNQSIETELKRKLMLNTIDKDSKIVVRTMFYIYNKLVERLTY